MVANAHDKWKTQLKPYTNKPVTQPLDLFLDQFLMCVYILHKRNGLRGKSSVYCIHLYTGQKVLQCCIRTVYTYNQRKTFAIASYTIYEKCETFLLQNISI